MKRPRTLRSRLVRYLWLAPALLTATLAIPLILIDYGGPDDGDRAHRLRAADDQNSYHLVAIDRFSVQLPAPDVSDYPSATTPGFHLLMAAAKRGLNLSEPQLRGLNLLFTLLLLGLVAGTLARRTSPAAAACLTTPLACSLYVVSAAAWLLPDNLAWLLVAAVLLLLWDSTTSARTLLVAAALLVALVAVRQSHIWAASLLWTAAWLDHAPPPRRDSSLLPPWPDNAAAWRRTLLSLAGAVAATLPACALLAWFIHLWGGLTPPMFQQSLSRPNFATPGLTLALLGVYCVFHTGFVFPALAARQDRARLLRLALLGAAGGLAIGALPCSTYSIEAGRFSGLWNIVRLTPTVGNRSLLFMALSTWGGACAALWLGMAPTRPRWLIASAGTAFTAAMTLNAMSWQRYLEPMLLLLTAVSAATLWSQAPAEARRRAAPFAWLGPTALAAALLATTLHSLQLL